MKLFSKIHFYGMLYCISNNSTPNIKNSTIKRIGKLSFE